MTSHRHLPGILLDIAEIAGVDAALAVARARGGTRAYFCLVPPDDHWLVELVGREKAEAICRALGGKSTGAEYEIPMNVHLSRPALWRELRRRLQAGQSKPEIARALGIHYKTVQAHKNGRRLTADDTCRQDDLFD